MGIKEQKDEIKQRHKQKKENYYISLIAFMGLTLTLLKILFFPDIPISKFINSMLLNTYKDSTQNIIIVFMIFISTISLYFFNANPKSKLAIILESIKRNIFNIFPIYGFNGKDKRNDFLRFGFKKSINNGLLYRRLIKKDGIDKAEYIKETKYAFQDNADIFFKTNKEDVEKYAKKLNLEKNGIMKNGSTKKFKELNNQNPIYENVFKTKKEYEELFSLIDAYLKKNTSYIIDIPLNQYKAIGIKNALEIKTIVLYKLKEEKIKEEKLLKIIEETEKIYKEDIPTNILRDKIIKIFEKVDIDKTEILKWEKKISKSVIFSKKALSQHIHSTAIDFQRTLIEENKFLGEINLEKFNRFANIYKLTEFYTIINMFMGLGSGLITSKLNDYTYQRVLDDFELYTSYKAVKQIKNDGTNDGSQEYDDRESRDFMIAYYKFIDRSKNRNEINNNKKRFNVIMNVSGEIDVFIDENNQLL